MAVMPSRVAICRSRSVPLQHRELSLMVSERMRSAVQAGGFANIRYISVRHEARLCRTEVRDLRCSAVVAVG